jgi:hypothetical protein
MTHPNYRRFGIYCRKNSDQWVRTAMGGIICITNGMCSSSTFDISEVQAAATGTPSAQFRAWPAMSALRSLATQIGPLVGNSLLFPRSDHIIDESCQENSL